MKKKDYSKEVESIEIAVTYKDGLRFFNTSKWSIYGKGSINRVYPKIKDEFEPE